MMMMDGALATSSSSDSSEDEREDDATDIVGELATYRYKVQFDPSYSSFEGYVRHLRLAMQYDELREARNDMANRFPLDAGIWMEWIEDEQRVNNDTSDIVALYERALSDFLSVALWERYIGFVSSLSPSYDDEDIRQLFERAIVACAHHFTESARIWGLYRQFECDRADVDRQRKLYVRQLGTAFHDLCQTRVSFDVWCEHHTITPNVPGYEKAIALYNEILPFEQSIRDADVSDLPQLWLSYIDNQLSAKPLHVALLTCIFERAIIFLFNHEECWDRYIRFARSNTLSDPVMLMKLCRRALRNCPWSVSVWCNSIRSASTIDATLKMSSELFDEAISQSFATGSEFVTVILEMCYAHMRCIREGLADVDATRDELRALFKRAAGFDEYSAQSLGLSETTYKLYRIWADFEAATGDIDTARTCWESLMTRNGGKDWFMWGQYIGFERRHGDIDHCRTLFRRATHLLQGDDIMLESACLQWIQFEAELGTVPTLDGAISRCTSMIKMRVAVNARRATMQQPVQRPKRKHSTVHGRSEKKAKKISDGVDVMSIIPTKDVESSVRVATAHYDANVASTVFVLNLPHHTTEQLLRTIFEEYGRVTGIRMPRDFRGDLRGFAYVEFASSDSIDGAIAALNGKAFLGHLIQVERSRPQSAKKAARSTQHGMSSSSDASTIFVKGFDKKATQAIIEEALRHRFAKYGTISQVRIPPALKGSYLKGVAFIQFQVSQSAHSALVENGFEWDDKAINVSLSAPPTVGSSTGPHRPPYPVRSDGPSQSHSRRLSSSRPRIVDISHEQHVVATGEVNNQAPPCVSNAAFRNMFLAKSNAN